MNINEHKKFSNEIYKLHLYHRHLIREFKSKKIKNHRKYYYESIPHNLNDRKYWRNGLVIDGKKLRLKLDLFLHIICAMENICCKDYYGQSEVCHSENGGFILYYEDLYLFRKHQKDHKFPPMFSNCKTLTYEDKCVIKSFMNDLIQLGNKVLAFEPKNKCIKRELIKIRKKLQIIQN